MPSLMRIAVSYPALALDIQVCEAAAMKFTHPQLLRRSLLQVLTVR